MSFLETFAAATAIPMETLSVAMTTVPKSVPILSNIYKLSSDIRETTERVATNKTQCEQLSERIDTLIGFLAQRDFSNCLNDAMHRALNRFETFLQRCLEYISTFLETTWLKRIVNNKDYERKFQDLNRELTQYANDLNFGIGLNNMQIKRIQEGEEEEDRSETIAVSTKMIVKDKGQRDNREFKEEKINIREIPTVTTPQPVVNIPPGPKTMFVSGLWNYAYKQYNQIYGPFPQELIFHSKTQTLQGRGRDNVGDYVLNGTFSEGAGKIKMTQTYQLGTGNPNLNLGHQDLIQLNWNASRNVFEGIAYSNVQGNYVQGAVIEMRLA